MFLLVEFNHLFFRIFFSVVEGWELECVTSVGFFNIFDEPIGVEGECCASTGVGLFRVIKLVQLLSIIVIAIHRHDYGVDIVSLFKKFPDIFCKVGLSTPRSTSYTYEWNHRDASNSEVIPCRISLASESSLITFYQLKDVLSNSLLLRQSKQILLSLITLLDQVLNKYPILIPNFLIVKLESNDCFKALLLFWLLIIHSEIIHKTLSYRKA